MVALDFATLLHAGVAMAEGIQMIALSRALPTNGPSPLPPGTQNPIFPPTL